MLETLERENLEKEVKTLIVERLNLNMDPIDIDSTATIFLGSEEAVGKTGLGLDSVDALELVVGLNSTFEITITDEDMNIFESVAKIVDFIIEKKSEQV